MKKQNSLLEEIKTFIFLLNIFRTIIKTFALNKHFSFLDETKEEEIEPVQMEIILPAHTHPYSHTHAQRAFLINSWFVGPLYWKDISGIEEINATVFPEHGPGANRQPL